MVHRTVLLLLACGPLAGFAAPVPVEDDLAKVGRVYGTWADPDKDCRFTLTGTALKVALPASDHLVGKLYAKVADNAPRALREVDGDLTVVVHVAIPIPDDVHKASWRYCSGGMLASESDTKYYIIRLCGGGVNGSRETVWGHHLTGEEGRITVRGLGAPVGKAFVRLTRAGQKMTASWSRDGKKWTEFAEQDVAWGPKVKVGVAAESNVGKQIEVTFDQYSLTQPKK